MSRHVICHTAIATGASLFVAHAACGAIVGLTLDRAAMQAQLASAVVSAKVLAAAIGQDLGSRALAELPLWPWVARPVAGSSRCCATLEGGGP